MGALEDAAALAGPSGAETCGMSWQAPSARVANAAAVVRRIEILSSPGLDRARRRRLASRERSSGRQVEVRMATAASVGRNVLARISLQAGRRDLPADDDCTTSVR